MWQLSAPLLPSELARQTRPAKDNRQMLEVMLWRLRTVRTAGEIVTSSNPGKASRYDGLKYSDDFTDARWLAEMRRLGIGTVLALTIMLETGDIRRFAKPSSTPRTAAA